MCLLNTLDTQSLIHVHILPLNHMIICGLEFSWLLLFILCLVLISFLLACLSMMMLSYLHFHNAMLHLLPIHSFLSSTYCLDLEAYYWQWDYISIGMLELCNKYGIVIGKSKNYDPQGLAKSTNKTPSINNKKRWTTSWVGHVPWLWLFGKWDK